MDTFQKFLIETGGTELSRIGQQPVLTTKKICSLWKEFVTNFCLPLSQDKIEHTLERLDQQIAQDWDDKEMIMRVEEQQRQLERQLTRVRGQLATGTKVSEVIGQTTQVCNDDNGNGDHEGCR